MNCRRRRILVAAVAGVALAGWGTRSAWASPYAGQINESSGNVNFTLSDSADEVIVVRDGVATSLGAQAAGTHSFARNGAVNYQIIVNKNAAAGFLNATAANTGAVNQISNDAASQLQFDRITGLAVNKNPQTPALFGRVYAAAPRDALTATGRLVSEGVYIFNADLSDAFGQQDNGSNSGTGFKAGLDSSFSGGGSSSPYRLELDKDGNLYIGDWADATGTVYRTSADVGQSGGVNLLAGQGSGVEIAPTTTLNHGSVAGMVLDGSSNSGNLVMWTVDEDLSPNGNATQLNSVWRYDLGSTTANYNGIPTQVAHDMLLSNVQGGGVICDIARLPGANQKFYLVQNRTDGNEPGLVVVSPTGQKLYDSLSDSIARGLDGNSGLDGIQDLFRSTRGIDISPDGQYLALATNNAGDTWIVPLLDGIPDMPNALRIDTFTGATSHEAAFDAAGNLYVGNWSSELLREFVGGGVSQTIYNSNGTFKVLNGPTWTATGGGNYSTGGNWLLGSVPNGTSVMATFQGNTAPVTVTLDAPTTLGNVRFDSANSFTIAGANTLTLSSLGEPRITVLSGSHTISAPVVATQNTQFTVAQGSTLTVSNFTLNNPAANIVTAGPGTTALNNYRAAALSVNNGTAQVIPNGTNAGTSYVKALNIAGASNAWTAKLDLTNNGMVVDWTGTDPSPTLLNQIKSGYAGGAWTGNGITSSLAAAAASTAHKTAIGYAASSGAGTFLGQPVDADAFMMRYTFSGDANLDGRVDTIDFNALASNFGGSGKVWTQADFNYDNVVDTQDFNLLASNFGQQLPDGGGAGGAGALVPEPTSLALAGLAVAGLARRRRR